MVTKSLAAAVVAVVLTTAFGTATAYAAASPSGRSAAAQAVEKTCAQQARTARKGNVLCTWTESGVPTRAQADRLRKDVDQRRAALRAETGPARNPAKAHAAVANSPVLDECLSRGSSNWVIDRTEACLHVYLHVSIRETQPPYLEIGHLVFELVYDEYLMFDLRWGFTASFTKVGDSGLTDSTVMNGGIGCTGGCVVEYADGFVVPVDTATSFGGGGVFDGPIYLPGQRTSASVSVTTGFTRPNTLIGPPNTTTAPLVRCDSVFDSGGCVVLGGPPERFFLDEGVFPEVVRHIKASQATGAPGENIPLTRTEDDNQIGNNRIVSCPWTAPRPPGLTCDEYPFASTREGAARAPSNGQTFFWCDVSWLDQPGRGLWSACMVSEWENFMAGNELGNFYQQWRILDGDEFYVDFF